eukprot:NODE_2_length_91304_cov_0.692462.p20 type:complete len:403 gc:universal NODE_2_length_91304_cov_0.692462:40042-38834(-)
MAHISTKSSGSVSSAILLMLKGFIGTGVLFLPKAFLNGGIGGSFLLLVLMATLSLCGMYLLFKSSLVIPGSYQDIAGVLYGTLFRNSVRTSLVFCQFGFVMVYMLFVASNIKDLVSTLTNCRYEIHDWFILIAVQLIIYIPLVLIRNIQSLAKFALFGNILMFTGIFFVLFNCTLKIISNPAEIHLFNSLGNTSLFLGTAIFTYEGFGLVIPISQSMKEPRKFGMVLVTTLLLVSIIYILIGTLGLAAFGDAVETVILLNFPSTIALQVIQIGYVIAVMLSLPLQFFPAIEILEEPLFSKDSYSFTRKVYRSALTIIAALIAFMGTNSLDIFVSFIGAFCGMPVSFIYPPLLYLKSCAKHSYQKFFCYFLICFGIIATIFASSIAFHKLLYGEVEIQVDRCK